MNANDLFKAVTELDLEPIKTKLMHAASGEGWSLEKATAVEKEYRRFLCLMKMFPEEIIAPLVDVDTFWHYHILDTMKYAADCEKAFGYFLHHYPYLGMHGEDDEQVRLGGADRMRTLYESIFGEAQVKADKASAAFCAGPHAEAAFCAGPHARAGNASRSDGAISAAAAFCAGPHAEAAFCAGPHSSRSAQADRPSC